MQACCNNSEYDKNFASVLYSQSLPNGRSDYTKAKQNADRAPNCCNMLACFPAAVVPHCKYLMTAPRTIPSKMTMDVLDLEAADAAPPLQVSSAGHFALSSMPENPPMV